MSREVTVSEVLDRIPVGRFHRRLLGICGSAWAFDGMEVILISFTLPVLSNAWGLTGIFEGLLGSASLMGMIAGNWIWGAYADTNGRKKAFEWTVLFYSVFTGLTALATGFYSGFGLRFLTGVGLGGALAVDTSYLSEHLPTQERGKYVVYLDAFWPLGNLLAVVLAWFFLSVVSSGGMIDVPFFGEVANWRVLFAAASFPALTVFVIRRGLSETPYYLALKGEIEAANDRIREIAEENGEEFTPISAEEVRETPSPGFSRLFESDLRKQTAMITTAWFGVNLGYYGVFIWLPSTVGAAGVVGNVTVGGLTFESIYLYFVLIAVVQFPGYFSAAYLVERIGRKPTLGSYLVLSGVFTFVFAVSMPDVSFFGIGAESSLSSFIAGLLGASFFALGAWGAIYAYTPELFPTEARATGNGFAGGVGKIGAVIGPILAGVLVGRGYLVALAPLAASFVLGGVVVLLLGRETKGEPLF